MCPQAELFRSPFAGALPPLAAAGRQAVGHRYGLVGSFVVAAVVWRIVRLIPLFGFVAFFLVVIWGMGAWVIAMWHSTRFSKVGAAERTAVPVRQVDEARPASQVDARLELLGLEKPEGSP